MSIRIFLLILIGGFFRFYNLNWGNPFYFHPDERNIASAIIQLNFPNQMNPHFFAYGSFPIYLIYFTVFVINFFSKSQDLFIQSILISRFYSAILSLLIIPSSYYIGKKLGNKQTGLIAAIFCTFSVGFIQFAHFGTFEMWITFLGMWLFYFSLNLIKKIKLKTILIVGILFGLLMTTKVSSFLLLAIPIISITLNILSKKSVNSFNLFVHLFFITIFKILTVLCVSLIVFIITSPYVLIDFPSFISSLRYESSVALGTLSVFYTGEFFNSIPVVFQFTKIYPFLLNLLITIILIPSLIYLTFIAFKKNNKSYLLLISCFLLLFIPQAFLFAKWTRYIAPTLPFIYLIVAIFFERFVNKKILYIIIFINIVFAVSYFITAFVKQDTRIETSLWAKENVPAQSIVLSEVYDMGIIPFNQYLPNISLFNFYDLDQSQELKSMELNNVLERSEYVILSSPRILKTRLINKSKFPIGNKFYRDLLNGKLNFKKIYETPCDIFCKITYLGDPVFSFEGTVNVFERPTIFIFKKPR